MEKQFNTLKDWLNWLESCHFKSIDLSLERIQLIANKLGLNKFSIPVITVAGTNGKGSTIAAIESCYLAQGYQTGVYTSPHLFEFNERVRLNGQAVSDKTLMTSFELIYQQLDDISLTYFEFTTLAALLIFKSNMLDVLILEVGLGGRFDAVNIVDSDVQVITTIDYDHQSYLGDTREQIGREKSGIIRQDKPVVVMETNIPSSVTETIKQKNAMPYFYQQDYSIDTHEHDWSWHSSETDIDKLHYKNLPISNMATALMVIELLQERLPMSVDMMRQGVNTVSMQGRCQVVCTEPYLIVDVAHNAQSAKRFAEFIRPFASGKRVYAIFSALADKALEQLVEPVAAYVNEWHIASVDSSRAANCEQMVNAIKKYTDKPCLIHDTINNAKQELLANVTSNDMIIVYGSFLTVQEALRGKLPEYEDTIKA